MEKSLQEFLLNKGYIKIKLKFTKTNHFEMKVSINGFKGLFILDTGASTSCIGFEHIDYFNLKVKDSNIKAAGAGATDMSTQISKKSKIKIGKWKLEKLKLVVFNIDHINLALTSHKAKPIHGIIGADLLKQGKGIIDYEKKQLYLKKV